MNLTGATLAAALFLGPIAVEAATITSVSGTWTAAAPATAISGINSSTISWGKSTGQGKSSYNFSSSITPRNTLTPDEGDVFVLGSFTHTNRPVTGTTLTNATLRLNVSVDIDGEYFSFWSDYAFAHEETLNQKPCTYAGSSICDDRVTFSFLDSSVPYLETTDGSKYTFALDSFSLNMNGTQLVDAFQTKENKKNKAYLVGSFSVEAPAPELPAVPVPAALPLLLGGMGIFGALGLRKRRKA